MKQVYDEIFIGSGLSSLSLAAILAKEGKKVLVLERAKEFGGCASSYTKDGYRYDAGATTLVGWEKGLPLNRLFELLGVQKPNESKLSTGEVLIEYLGLSLILLKPSMKIVLPENSNSQNGSNDTSSTNNLNRVSICTKNKYSIPPISTIPNGNQEQSDDTNLIPTNSTGIKNIPVGSMARVSQNGPSNKLNLSLTRSQDRQDWIFQCGKIFGEPACQKRFWKSIFFLSDCVWNTSLRMTHFPPVRFIDFLNCLRKIRLIDIILFICSFFTIRMILSLPGFPKSKLFKKFLDEQLLITVQTTHDLSPLSMGAAGICYAHLMNTYVKGGMGELANFLVRQIQNSGGEVKSFEEVKIIQLPKDSEGIFSITTRKGNEYQGKRLYSGIPIWNLPGIIHYESEDREVSKPYRKYRLQLLNEIESRCAKFSKEIWGAFNLSIAMEDFRNLGDPIHYQFHLSDSLSYGGGESIFVSCSHSTDSTRILSSQSPNTSMNIVLLSISTHIKNPESWNRKSIDYQTKKNKIQSEILEFLERNWEGFKIKNIMNIHSSSPETWKLWTGRYAGRVGGIPGFYFRNPLSFPSSRTPFPNFFLLGDTVYPGQGIPAVILGSINLYTQMNLD